MNITYSKKQTEYKLGFTIVELLIVIVVIGILAAITIIAFNGIQERARNSQTSAVVSTYKKALGMYLIDKGTYPVFSSACLGEGYSQNCWSGSNNAAFNDAIRPYMNNSAPLPIASNQVLTYRGGPRVGATLYYNTSATLDGQPHPWILVYYMEGVNQRCTVGPVASIVGPGWHNLSSTRPANDISEYGPPHSLCLVPMPLPSNA